MFFHRNHYVGISIQRDSHEPEEFTRFTMHTHSTAALFYFVSGRAVYHIEGNSYVLQPGDILLMRPSEAYYVEQDPNVPYDRICLNFETTLLSTLDPENTLLRPYYDREAGERNLYRTASTEHAVCRTYLDNILNSGDRLEAIANLILLLRQVRIMFEKDNENNSQPDTLEYRLVHFINQNLDKELSIQHLCSQFYISRARLCRRFKKITGTSVGKYVTAKRLMAAQNLLRQGKKPTEVYEACGYQDYSTFYRAYLQYFGYSPKDIRLLNEPHKDRMEIV